MEYQYLVSIIKNYMYLNIRCCSHSGQSPFEEEQLLQTLKKGTCFSCSQWKEIFSIGPLHVFYEFVFHNEKCSSVITSSLELTCEFYTVYYIWTVFFAGILLSLNLGLNLKLRRCFEIQHSFLLHHCGYNWLLLAHTYYWSWF